MSIDGARELKAELKAIQAGKHRPVYLVFGSEDYLVRNSADAIVAAIAEGTGAEIDRVDASSGGVAAVLQPVASLSLFASSKVAVVRNFTHLLTGDTADQLLSGLDAGIGEGSALVFVASTETGDKIDKRVKGYKGLVKRGAALEFNTQKPEHLEMWLRAKAKEADKRLAPDAAALLLTRVGTHMNRLKTELDKCLLYCLDEEEITASAIEPLVGKSREDAVWDVTEALSSGRLAQALRLVGDLFATGTYPLVLLTLLVRQTRHLLQARLLWEAAGCPEFRDMRSYQARVATTFESGAFGSGADDVTTIHPFACFKRFEAARAHSVASLRETLIRLRRADSHAKTGKAASPQDIVEHLILELGTRGRSAARSAA